MEFLVPSPASEPKTPQDASFTVHRSDLGQKLVHNKTLDNEEMKFFDNYDHTLSINNFGASCLDQLKGQDSIMRQVHTLAHDTPLASYFGLKFSILDYPRLFVTRKRQMSDESKLKGVKTLCVSRYLTQRMRAFELEREENLFHVPNGLDTRLFSSKQKEKQYDLLFVGRFERAKGLDVLIAALNILEKKERKYKLGIVGYFKEDQKRFCLSLASRKVAESIEFLGNVRHEELPRMLSSGRALVSPSRNESFGLAILEAMACGLPIAATRAGGIPELVDQEVGVLAEPDNPASLAGCISQALEDGTLVERAARLGPQRASKYDWDHVIGTFVELL